MAKSHTLLELSQSIERLIQTTFNRSYWVSAEISKLNFYPKSGHCYPELVEKSNGKIVAEIRSTIWNRTYLQLSSKFQKETGETIREGMKILFAVQVKYSPTHGISLNIVDIDPSYTLGEIAKEKKKTIAKLKEQGVFEANKKMKLAYFPNRLAVISVISSKGYQDFIQTMELKASQFKYEHVLFPAILQGDNAVKSINEQLEIIENRAPDFDAVLIIRGGGGDVGLNCYNNHSMAHKVATFPIPVISGIGHSTNETVVEMVAHTNKITPTAVADGFVEIYRNLETEIYSFETFLQKVVSDKIEPKKQNLLNWLHFLKAYASTPLSNERLRLNKLESQLNHSSKNLIDEKRNKLDNEYWRKLEQLGIHQIFNAQKKLQLLETKLTLLDPKHVLKRGYSLSSINGKAVSSVTEIKPGDTLTTQLYNGIVDSEIKEIKNE